MQTLAARRDAERYPAPGRMVDVGGYRLHLQVVGDGSGGPTVVLEAGLDSFSTNWYWVQTALASSMRVVAYDRAGLGWSDDGSTPRDAQHSAADLRTALQRAGIGGPYILAGHSYGGLVVRAFADQYPDEVVGLVLVDASHPDQWLHIPMSMRGAVPGLANRVTAMLAAGGLLRVWDPLTPQIAMGLPEHQYAEMRAIIALPRTSWTGAQTLAAWDRADATEHQRRAQPGRSATGGAECHGAAAGRRNLDGTAERAARALEQRRASHRRWSDTRGSDLQAEHAEEVAAAIRDVARAAVTGARVVDSWSCRASAVSRHCS